MVEINEMVIRVPGMEKTEARSIGEMVAGKMAEGLTGETGNRKIDELNMRVSLPEGISGNEMAENIGQQILNQMKKL